MLTIISINMICSPVDHTVVTVKDDEVKAKGVQEFSFLKMGNYSRSGNLRKNERNKE